MIDGTLTYIIDYFSGVLVNLTGVAMQIGRWIAVLGFIWTGFEMAAGTKDVQKFLVGNIVRYTLFFIAMTFYQPVVAGLLRLSSEIAERGSAQSISSVTKDFVKTLNEQQKIAEKAAEGNTGIVDAASFVVGQGSDTVAGKKSNQRVVAIQKLLKETGKDELGNTQYVLDLDFKRDGKSTGFISPDAFVNLALLSAQLIYDNEMTFDVVANANNIVVVENEEQKAEAQKEAKKNKKRFQKEKEVMTSEELQYAHASGQLSSFSLFKTPPFAAIVRLVLCVICIVAFLCTTVAGLIQYIMAITEYFISTGISIILVPLMLMDNLKDYATRVITTLFGQVLKLVVMTLIMYFAAFTFMELASRVTGDTSQFGFPQFVMVIFTSFLTFILTSHAPSIAQTIASGSPQMSMGEFMRGVGAVAGGVALAKATGKTVGSTAWGGLKLGGAGLTSFSNGARLAVKGVDPGANLATKAYAAFKGGTSMTARNVGAKLQEQGDKFMHAIKGGGKAANDSDRLNALRDGKKADSQHQSRIRTAHNASNKKPGGGGEGGGSGYSGFGESGGGGSLPDIKVGMDDFVTK